MRGLLPGGQLRRTGRRRPVVAMAVSAVSAVAIAVSMAAASPAMAARTLPAAVKAAAIGARPWLEQGRSPGQRASELLARMTLAQKLQMMDGTGYPIGSDYAGHIQGIAALGIPDLYLSDGAVGVGNGSTGVTWFPDGTNDAATWDPPAVQAAGAADGREQAAKGHNVSLAPNLNILRTPYGGRAFEGYGEDPYLSSQIAAADIQGVQSQGVIATPKHYIGNDQETLRNSIDVQVSQRALAEIYDPAFQASINAGAGAAMCSYNMVNGSYSCQNSQTLAGTLESVMQFKGFVMSDWGATHSTVPSVEAGLDMSMPGGTLFGPDYYGAPLAAAARRGGMLAEVLLGQGGVALSGSAGDGALADLATAGRKAGDGDGEACDLDFSSGQTERVVTRKVDR